MYSIDERFQRSREDYFCVYFPSCEATREINTKITLEWAQKQTKLKQSKCRKILWYLAGILNDVIWLNVKSAHPRRNGHHFTDDIFKCIFLNEDVWIPIKIAMNFVPLGSFDNMPALVQIMARRLPGDEPLSEAIMINLPTQICVTRPQWVKIVDN